MELRKITANYVYTGVGEPLKNGILVFEGNTIVDIIERRNDVQEIANLEFYGGMLVPAFIDMFVLLAYPQFSISDFEQWVASGVLELPEPNIASMQRGVNHLEAFGTRGAVDFFSVDESAAIKLKSKVIFAEQPPILNLPTHRFNSDAPILVNRYTATSKDAISQTDFKNCVIGTGSLQSHGRLSVFEELKYLQQHLSISIFELLKWATVQPANMANLTQLGSFEIGKTAGANLITAIDYKKKQLTPQSELITIMGI